MIILQDNSALLTLSARYQLRLLIGFVVSPIQDAQWQRWLRAVAQGAHPPHQVGSELEAAVLQRLHASPSAQRGKAVAQR